jgi:branched-chain amino acid transport system ATP-binding protein
LLFGVDLDVGISEVVSLLGRNGMGKTTMVRTLMGLLPPIDGQIRFEGRPIAGEPPFRVAQAGIGLVPEGRQIFPTLTVEENLVATDVNRRALPLGWTLDRVYTFFRISPSAARTLATRYQAASNRCWRLAAL